MVIFHGCVSLPEGRFFQRAFMGFPEGEMAQLDKPANRWDFTEFMGNIHQLGDDLPGNQTWLAGKSPTKTEVYSKPCLMTPKDSECLVVIYCGIQRHQCRSQPRLVPGKKTRR